VLQSEAALGHVRLYATFSDGTTLDVSGEAGVELSSADPSVVEVVGSRPANDPAIRVTAEVRLVWPPFIEYASQTNLFHFN
jgi:hypothetical protein